MAAHAYLNLAAFMARSTMPRASLLEVERLDPGHVAARLAARSAEIDARLRKRYASPFEITSTSVTLLDYSDSALNDAGEWEPPPASFSPPRHATHVACNVEAVTLWLTALVTYDAYRKLGFDPSSAQDATVIDEYNAAQAALTEAANSETGIYDLPLRADKDASAIVHGGPFAYSEASPYEWTDQQAEAIRGR